MMFSHASIRAIRVIRGTVSFCVGRSARPQWLTWRERAMPHCTRRQFLLSGAVAGGLAATAGAIEPIRRTAKPQMRLSLAAYSFRQYLNLKKPAMTLADFIDSAAGWPLDAVELTGYYFRETSAKYLAGLKGRCTRLGLDVSGTAVGNNFTSTDAGRLKTEIADV